MFCIFPIRFMQHKNRLRCRMPISYPDLHYAFKLWLLRFYFRWHDCTKKMRLMPRKVTKNENQSTKLDS